MIERTIIRKISDPTLRGIAERIARLILENWFYLLALIILWRFPYIVADLSDTEVQPRRPTGESVFWQSVMAQSLVLACLAMSYNLLFGFSGVISFGHALFFGAGGYITFILMSEYNTSLQFKALIGVNAVALALALFTDLPIKKLFIFLVTGLLFTLLLLPDDKAIGFYQAVGLAMLGSIALSLVSGAVTLRLRGVYFTMFTLALAEMFFVLAKSGTFRNITGAEDGLVIRDLIPERFNPTKTFEGNRLYMYNLTLVYFAVVFLAIRRYLNSPVGRVMLAIRENEERARAIGYNTFNYKLMTMAFAGIIASMSGVLFVLWGTAKRVDPGLLSLNYTVQPLLYTLIGGVGTLIGPVLAALGLELGETYLRSETFSMQTTIIGPLTLQGLIVLLLTGYAALFLYQRRDAIRTALAHMRESEGAGSKLSALSSLAGTLIWAGLILAWAAYAAINGLGSKEYNVSEYWDLFLGLAFVVVVMMLPNGIVGTWNRWWAERRFRRLERDLQRKRESEQASALLSAPKQEDILPEKSSASR